MVLVSFAYYENSTKPKGLTFETGNYTNFYVTPGTFEIFALQNASFLGNNINVGYAMVADPFYHYVNLSNTVAVNITRGCMINSFFCMTSLTSVHWPFSNPVVTVLNTSLSVNNPIFKNGTDKNDNFGPYWTYSESSNIYCSEFNLYEKGDYQESNNSANRPPISLILNPGNYTFYENITYTVSLSMGFMHFTSQPFHFDQSWWVVYQYKMTNTGKRY